MTDRHRVQQDAPVALVGRDEELTVARAALMEGGCALAGDAGVGKSRLAAEVVAGVAGPVERVLATASARTIPFGALDHVLAPAREVGGPEIRSLITSLRERFPKEPLTLVVDDAHHLDDASAALLLALAQTRTARLLLTLRNHEPAPDAVVSLWKERRVERIDLQPLSRAETRRLIEAVLGGPAHTAVVAKVFDLTEGNPLYVNELVTDAVRSEALALDADRWNWTGSRPVLTRLRDLIELRTRGLSSGAHRALELLAMCAPIDLRTFEELADAAHLEELERSGLARVTDQRGPVEVEIAHPLYGEVIADTTPGSVALVHRRDLASALRSRERLTGSEVVRAATWLLEAGEVDHDLFVQASHEALRATSGVPGMGWGRDDADLALRLAEAAEGTFQAAMASALARLAVNRGAEVDEILAPYEADAAAATIDVSCAYVRARAFGLYWGASDYDGALAVLDRSAPWHDDPNWTAFLAMVRSWVLLELGQPEEGTRQAEPFVYAEDLDPTVRLELLVVYGLGQARLGLIDQAEALEPEIEAVAAQGPGAGVGTEWAIHMVDAFVRTEAARELEAVAARLEAARDTAEHQGNESLAASIQMVIGRLALIRGHAEDAIAALQEAIDGMTYGAERTGLGLAHTYLARAHALMGETGLEAAAEQLKMARELLDERPRNQRLTMEVHRAEAWLEAASGHLAEAAQRLLAVAEEAGEDRTGRSEALYGALRLGAHPSACAEALVALADEQENELYERCAAHARALAADDPDGQLEAAQGFAELGVDLFAAEAATNAALAFSREGRRSKANRAAALAATHAARCQGASTPVLAMRPEAAVLTNREREVAALAARGLSNRTIAEDLGVSVRTVESMVLRASAKLGVNSRGELLPFFESPETVVEG